MSVVFTSTRPSKGAAAPVIDSSLGLRAPVPTVVPFRKLPRAALAGGLAGAIVNSVLHPIDTIKSVRQADTWRRSQSTWSVFWQLVRESGPGALYRGVVPAVLGAATSSAVYFGTYESVRALLVWYEQQRHCRAKTGSQATHSARDAHLVARSLSKRGLIHMIAAASGNVVSSFIFVPKEVIKQRLQTGRESTVREVFAHQHLRGLYWGYRATLLRNVPNAMLNFVLYEELKLRIGQLRTAVQQCMGGSRTQTTQTTEAFPTLDLLIAGSLAGALSSTLTTPFDVLKTRFGTASSSAVASRSLMSLAAEILRQEGLGGLFRGVGTRAVWAGMFSAIGFTTYERCKDLLVSHASSSKRNAHLQLSIGRRRRQRQQ
jgi:solute carrier family 25 S-adenosylmethionine transporter 26